MWPPSESLTSEPTMNLFKCNSLKWSFYIFSLVTWRRKCSWQQGLASWHDHARTRSHFLGVQFVRYLFRPAFLGICYMLGVKRQTGHDACLGELLLHWRRLSRLCSTSFGRLGRLLGEILYWGGHIKAGLPWPVSDKAFERSSTRTWPESKKSFKNGQK